MFFKLDAVNPTNTAELNFNMSGMGYKEGTRNEEIGTIAIFNPFNDAAGLKRAPTSINVILKSGGEPVTITDQSYFICGAET